MNTNTDIEVKKSLVRVDTPSLIRLCEDFLVADEKGHLFSLIRSELKNRGYPLIKIMSVEVTQNEY